MNKKLTKYRFRKRLVLVILALIIFYLGYYQLWHHSKELNGKIYTLNKTIPAHLSDTWAVKFFPNGKWLASGSVDSTIKIWDKETGVLIHSIKQPEGITGLDISPDGNYLVTTSYDSKVRIWKLPEDSLVKELHGHTGTVWTVNYSPDGKLIASAGEDSTIKIWSAESGQIVQSLKGHGRNIWTVKFSPDGTRLASGSFDQTIRIWNISDGKLLQTLTEHHEAVVAIAFSHDGQTLASTSDDKTIKLWNTNNWQLIYTLNTAEHNQAAEFSPDDKWLLTGGRDKTTLGELLQNIFGDSKYNPGVSMHLWDAKTGELLQTFSKHYNDVNDVCFSPDGKWIATASSDHTIELWQR